MTAGYAAIVLAGGGGRRLGGRDKPALPVGGRSMLHRVLDAVAAAAPRIVVGPVRRDLPVDVTQVREEPPGGGPVAALAAGMAALGDDPGTALTGDDPSTVLTGGAPGFVAVLAADLPFLAVADIAALRRAAAHPDHDGAVLVDADGRHQWLCGVWRTGALRRRLAEVGPPAGLPMRALVSGLRPAPLRCPATAGPPPWYDCDTEDDYRRAEEWT